MGIIIYTMKLVVVTALLVAVAFAAPRSFVETDAVVPEESLVQSTTAISVADLKKQFHELQMQLQDGEEATPGVRRVINNMIALIETDIEKAINDAHQADQTNLNTQMDAIGDLNNVYTKLVGMLHKRRDTIENLIKDAIDKSAIWKGKSEDFTAAEAHYMKTYDNKTKTCCAKDNAGVLQVEYTPAYALCDYTKPEGEHCGNRAIKAAVDIVTRPFEDGLALWRALLAACNGLIVDLDAAVLATNNAQANCDTAKQNTKAAEKTTQEEKDEWSDDWDRTIKHYNGNYTEMVAKYKKTVKRVKSDEIDRKNEWKSTQEIKCMLKAYRDGGSFDSATQTKCSTGIVVKLDINYPKIIAQLTWKKHVFTDFTDASDYEETCTKRKPDPVFECVMEEPRPFPQCTGGL